MKYAVVGANGQLGQDFCRQLRDAAIPLARTELDLSQLIDIAAVLKHHQLTHLINCAAYNAVDRAEQETEAAFAVNTWGVQRLAAACESLGIAFVHISTDYVFGFDGQRREPYQECDAPGPVSQYGLSKLCGEYQALLNHSGALVVRTCGLFGLWGRGGKGGNFLETMLKHAEAGKALRVVNDQYCTPSYTVDVAHAILQLIQQRATGLYHVVNAGQSTWYDVAAELFRCRGMAVDLTPIPTSEYPTPARRPAYSVLCTMKLFEHGITLPPWQEAVAVYLAEREVKLRS
jgi:dTDP-4-dehydrorhamnose reductase